MAWICTGSCCKVPPTVMFQGREIVPDIAVDENGKEYIKERAERKIIRAIADGRLAQKAHIKEALLKAADVDKRWGMFLNPFKHGIRRKAGTKRSDSTLWMPFRGL